MSQSSSTPWQEMVVKFHRSASNSSCSAKYMRRLTTRWSRPGQPNVGFGAILVLGWPGGSSRGR